MTWIQTSLLLDKYVYYLQKNHIKETCACCTRFCTVLWLSLSPRYPEVHNCKQLACFPIALPGGRWSDIAVVAHNSIWSEEGGFGMAARVTDPAHGPVPVNPRHEAHSWYASPCSSCESAETMSVKCTGKLEGSKKVPWVNASTTDFFYWKISWGMLIYIIYHIYILYLFA